MEDGLIEDEELNKEEEEEDGNEQVDDKGGGNSSGGGREELQQKCGASVDEEANGSGTRSKSDEGRKSRGEESLEDKMEGVSGGRGGKSGTVKRARLEDFMENKRISSSILHSLSDVLLRS